MKHNSYVVTFKNGKTVLAYALNEEEAKILAQATMINYGMAYDVESIRESTGFNETLNTDFVA